MWLLALLLNTKTYSQHWPLRAYSLFSSEICCCSMGPSCEVGPSTCLLWNEGSPKYVLWKCFKGWLLSVTACSFCKQPNIKNKCIWNCIGLNCSIALGWHFLLFGRVSYNFYQGVYPLRAHVLCGCMTQYVTWWVQQREEDGQDESKFRAGVPGWWAEASSKGNPPASLYVKELWKPC